MILDIFLSDNKSELLFKLDYFVIYVGVSMRSLSEDSSDKYTGDIVDVSDYYRYWLKLSSIIYIIL